MAAVALARFFISLSRSALLFFQRKVIIATNDTVCKRCAWSTVLLLLRVERNFQGSPKTLRLEQQSPGFLNLGDLLKATKLATDKSKTILFSTQLLVASKCTLSDKVPLGLGI